ncbi:flavin reductase [Nonomuraea terrae]|nr:flavin reductase [Nonomuraea terrae]
MKLFCLTRADGPAGLQPLRVALQPDIDVVPIEPSGGGRGDRPGEPSPERAAALIANQAGEGSYAVFGCHLGGPLVYEAVRRLVEAGHRSPHHLFVSAGPLRRRHGDGAAAGERPWLSPTPPGSSPGLSCPVTVVTGGEESALTEQAVAQWTRLTSGPVTRWELAGVDHSRPEGMTGTFAARIRSALLGDGPGREGQPLDQDLFRDAMAHLAAPVTVVTTVGGDGRPHAFTASAVCSLSADPPLLLVCVNRSGSAHDVFTTADRFLVNVLGHEQAHVARAFARHLRAEDEARLATLELGLPGLPDASARFACTRQGVLPGGDHSILVGRPEQVALSGAPPLIHYRRGWHQPAALPAHRPSQPFRLF